MDVLNLVAAIIIFLEAILGIIFSSLVIFIYFVDSGGRTSFNLICLSRAINNVVVLFTHFLILDGPTALFSRNIWSPAVETLIMNPSVNVYIVNEFQTLLIAVNRFIAMFVPVWYHQLFSNKVTAVFLACLYFVRGYICVGQVWDYFEEDCLLYLELEEFGGLYINETCNTDMPTGFEGLFIIFWPLALFGVTVVLNLMTFTKILRFYLGRNMDFENVEPVKRNIKLFFQTVLQDSLFFVDILFTFQLSGLSTHRIWQFVCRVAVWGLVLMLDGSSNFYPALLETIIITTTINVYLVNQVQTVAIALNRFIALYFPFRYKTFCSIKVTAVIVGAIYAQRGFETLSKMYSFISLNCYIHMDGDTFYTPYNDKNCSKLVGADSSLVILMPFIFLSITIILNLMTFAKILHFYFTNNANSESSSLARKNIRLFFQTVFQDSLFLIDATFTFKLSALSDSRLWAFISIVFVWESIHNLDGFIMLMFSDRLSILRARFREIGNSNQVSSSSGIRVLRRGRGVSSSLPGVN